ncbi:MAG: DEAD/DEAH box helicase [Planctomycetota bacterium]|nr:DEAD/DEAH box helicase [Planctomycetota bacterium]
MALNPITYTEKIVSSFLKYQVTAYPFADERLHRQLRELLSLEVTRDTPLLQGPYVSLSRPFRQGATVEALVEGGVLHTHLRQLIPFEHVYGHQEQALRAIHDSRTTLISTGTGSGKTECFLYPIISRCLQLRDDGATPGISAVIVYPMNALAEDQLARLRELLAGTGITFGMYVGSTPSYERDVVGVRLPATASRAEYLARLEEVRREQRGVAVHPPEEVCSREVMRTAGRQPRILLTNVKQLELLLTRQVDIELFADARLDHLVFDEAHTFTGAQGAETACLIRRLRQFCGRSEQDTVCVATSATIVDESDPQAARKFASRFFGVPQGRVETVNEAYEPEVWRSGRTVPPPPSDAPGRVLERCLAAVDDDEPDTAVRDAYRLLAGVDLPSGDWEAALHEALSSNELVYQINEALDSPRALRELLDDLAERVGRAVTEEELLCWLTLGAAARRDGRPLLRPVVHGFIRGIAGAVVTFPEEHEGPKLWLAAEDEIEAAGDDSARLRLPLTTCTTCGQHYYVTWLKDFEFIARAPSGGTAEGSAMFWEPLDEAAGGRRVVLVDEIVGADDEEEPPSARTAPLWFCRHCGAAHPEAFDRCLGCGMAVEPVELYAIRQKKETPGYLTSCLACKAAGRRWGNGYREPARPVRATTVADVHVLGQDMVHNAERKRLLVFADNRQEAAFQAGWMKDHARRFRLRALMAEQLRPEGVAIGDLTHALDDLFERDDALSKTLAPEVWRVARKEGTGQRHRQERRKFLRMQVLRELVLSPRQVIGLEPWGRLRIDYDVLVPTVPLIQRYADRLGVPAEDLRDGIATLLDYLRRNRVLFDPDTRTFSKYWGDGDLEIMQGYLPQYGAPVGTKLSGEIEEGPCQTRRWIGSGGETNFQNMVKKWGLEPDHVNDFLAELFEFLKSDDVKILIPARLTGWHGNRLPGSAGLYQVNADRMSLTPHRGAFRCRRCRRLVARRTPNLVCPGYRCEGTLEFVRDQRDNYDLQLLDESYSMVRPEEHTAMVPPEDRERIERQFKNPDSDVVNCLVCTPTLELGVDIGALDAILMRNVPPLPAHYWQRAGRAGRRHRMAVDVAYCQASSHDHAYYHDPLKMLAGRIDPPAFNLRNDVMVAKHVHATTLTRLGQLTRDASLPEATRVALDQMLKETFPTTITSYLFDESGAVRTTEFDPSAFRDAIHANEADLITYVESAFRQGWPDTDAEVVEQDALTGHITGAADELERVVTRLRRRLLWAMEQIRRLNRIRENQGDLNPEEESQYRRCDRMIKKMKGTLRRRRQEPEGYEDVYTYGVLAREGFLPGYGLESGQVVGFAEIPFWVEGPRDFVLPRPPSMAIREYVPGNLIYANGNKFVARQFRLEADERTIDMPHFEVSTEREAVAETNLAAATSSVSSVVVPAVAICDVDLTHSSHISDEEEYRFQMGVSVYGRDKGLHNGGTAHKWGERALHFRRGVHLTLVNVGANLAIRQHDRYGYPVCTVCGQSVSPLSSERQREHFADDHRQRCGRAVEHIGFFTDIVADAITLPACPSREEAYSVLEALRFAAADRLDMILEDLQILVIGYVDRDEVDGLLWDPMPGGSGLLERLIELFPEIVQSALDLVENCPAACDRSCIDCLQTYRNSFYHKHLDRIVVAERLRAWGDRLTVSHEIPARLPSPAETGGEALPVNQAERLLKELLIAAGFPEGTGGEQLRLDRVLGTTTPDVIYRGPDHDDDEGICIYLDGLSGHIHGNPTTAGRDREIRDWLRNNGYEVIEIAASDLYDSGKMQQHFRRLAGYLHERELRSRIREDDSWFERGHDAASGAAPLPFRRVTPTEADRFSTCVPLMTLEAAAGAFGESHEVEFDDWVELDGSRRIERGMFVARIVGRSMEPRIPDGSYGLFRANLAGSRNGRIVLVQHHDISDPEHGGRYTVKRYRSEKVESEDGSWRHVRIVLEPFNAEFEPITLQVDDETEVAIIAELVEVLGTS